MTHDSGFAPNPYYRYCTLATCTPNHMRANLEKDDVIVGVEANSLMRQRMRKLGKQSSQYRCIIYYMVISEQLSLDDYYRDSRFSAKKAEPASSSYAKRQGDNVYWRKGKGFASTPGNPHYDTHSFGQDTKGNRVFIGSKFFYFGDSQVRLPPRFEKYVPKNHGIKYTRRELPSLDQYVEQQAIRLGKKSGRIGHPIGREESSSCSPVGSAPAKSRRRC